MYKIFRVFMTSVAIAIMLTSMPGTPFSSGPAFADKKQPPGQAKKFDRDDDRDHGKRDQGQQNRGQRHHGGPPPWAPAHGYRRNSGHTAPQTNEVRYDEPAYTPPYGIDGGLCFKQILGGALGGAAGGYAGSKIGSGKGQLAATAAGAVIGILIGGVIGKSMDQLDQACVGQILEHAEDARPILWRDPNNDHQFEVTPTRTYQTNAGTYCRDYQTVADIGGQRSKLYGQACRQPDGSWKLAN